MKTNRFNDIDLSGLKEKRDVRPGTCGVEPLLSHKTGIAIFIATLAGIVLASIVAN